MARMRLQKDLYLYIKEKDPGTALTQGTIRRMALNGVFPYTQIENRKLYNLDDIDDLLDHPEKLQAKIKQIKQDSQHGKIRKIS